MPKPSCFSSPQVEWLKTQLPFFVNAREAKGMSEFVRTKVEEFLQKWPINPTQEGTKNADLANKQPVIAKIHNTIA